MEPGCRMCELVCVWAAIPVNFNLFMCAISIWWWKTPRSWSWQYSVCAKHGNGDDGDIRQMPNNMCPFVWHRINTLQSMNQRTRKKATPFFVPSICLISISWALVRVFFSLNLSFWCSCLRMSMKAKLDFLSIWTLLTFFHVTFCSLSSKRIFSWELKIRSGNNIFSLWRWILLTS